jgi:hypothetical protein
VSIEFKDWIIEVHEKMDSKCKPSFLRMLKFAPDRAREIIASSLDEWGMNFVFQTGGPLLVNPDIDSQEYLKVLQEHFAKEMDAITQ